MPKSLASVKIPNQIRYYRRKKNLKIKDVAKLMELSSPSHVAHWEKGRKLPSLINALKLAHITGSTVEIMFKPLFNQIRHEIHMRKYPQSDSVNKNNEQLYSNTIQPPDCGGRLGA